MVVRNSHPTLVSIDPTRGIAAGGTAVIVLGTNFAGDTPFVCKFGTNSVFGVYRTASSAVCAAPAGASGGVALSVSNNNVDFSGSVTYTYYGIVGSFPSAVSI